MSDGLINHDRLDLDINDIKIGIHVKNMRTTFDEESIKNLAKSILSHGLLQKLVVMETEDDNGNDIYELIAGERRFRAIKYIQNSVDDEFMAVDANGDGGVPCVTFEGAVHEAEFASGAENLDRQPVDVVDISAWLHRLKEAGISQKELADKVNKSLQWVNFRILVHERACDELKQALRDGIVPFTAAYYLASKLTPEEQAKKVEKHRKSGEKLSVEEAERVGNKNKTKRPSKKNIDAMLTRAEETDGEFADGIAAGLRYVQGLTTEEELEEYL